MRTIDQNKVAREPLSFMASTVDHPVHYNKGKIEVIDFIEDQGLSFHEGNVVKYICRAPYKRAELEDLKKARWYLERRIEQMEKDE